MHIRHLYTSTLCYLLYIKKIGGCWSWEPPVSSSSGIMVMGFASLLRVSSSLDIVTWSAINYQPQHTGIALNRPCHPGNQLRTRVFCSHFSGCPHPRTQIHTPCSLSVVYMPADIVLLCCIIADTRVIILNCQHEQLGAQPQLDTIKISSDMTPVMHDWISDTGHCASKSQMPPIQQTSACTEPQIYILLVLGATHIRLYIY